MADDLTSTLSKTVSAGLPSELSEETVDKILAIVVKEGLVDPARVTPDATLESLGIKSADMVMILMALEEQFGAYIPIDGPLTEAKTVEDFVRAIAPHLIAPGKPA